MTRQLLHAAAIADAHQMHEPGAVLLDGNRIIACGSPQDIGDASGLTPVDCTDSVLTPALVNAHAHLDLTHIGPVEYCGAFSTWAALVRSQRAGTEQAIRSSVQRGIELSRLGGTALIGDIAGVGSLVPFETMRSRGMAGVSFVEFFGIGSRQAKAVERIDALLDAIHVDAGGGVRIGLQPHAPYSCGPDVYRHAAARGSEFGLPLATHLAETLDEIQFTTRGDGPLADMLRHIGVWDDSITAPGVHPVDAVLECIGDQPLVAAHLNYIDDRHLPLLAASGISVAYCPRASAYFGHPHESFAPHPYRDMLAAGVKVALGTDSILCLDTPDRISVLDEMRMLYRRDGVAPQTLIRMATVNGAIALGGDVESFTLAPGPTAGLLRVAMDPDRSGSGALSRMLLSDSGPNVVELDSNDL